MKTAIAMIAAAIAASAISPSNAQERPQLPFHRPSLGMPFQDHRGPDYESRSRTVIQSNTGRTTVIDSTYRFYDRTRRD